MTAVAFFSDRNALVALHVALASTAANWPGPEPLDLYVFHRDLNTRDVALVDETIRMAGTPCRFHDAEFDTSRVAHWRGLYGSHMPYGRLFLPRLLRDEATAIYLDADVIVEMDVREIARTEPDLLAAMPAWDFAHSHDGELAMDIGVPVTDRYFHSGLLVIPLERWRSEDVVSRCLQFGDRYAARLWSHDQTILNFVCHGRIAPIPRTLTTHLYPTPTADALDGDKAIRNFCGSPKPFDPLGNLLNVHYELFHRWVARTAIAGWSPNGARQLLQLGRNIRLLKPIAATAVKRVVGALRGWK